ncbi:MAG: hypothetical protein U1F37_21175 [Alphaproteobacteria bacterium]
MLAEQRAADRDALVEQPLQPRLRQLAGELHAADLLDAVHLPVHVGHVGAGRLRQAHDIGLEVRAVAGMLEAHERERAGDLHLGRIVGLQAALRRGAGGAAGGQGGREDRRAHHRNYPTCWAKKASVR